MATATTAARRWAREYETIYILRPNVDPAAAEKVAERIAEVMERLGGKLTKVDNWGKRKLAYPIAKHTRGIFIYLRYVAFSDLVAELERNLRLLDDCIRYQTIVLEEQVDPASVEIDPEEVKFIPIEATEDEPEEDQAARLGLVSEEKKAASAESDEDGSDEKSEKSEKSSGEEEEEEEE